MNNTLNNTYYTTSTAGTFSSNYYISNTATSYGGGSGGSVTYATPPPTRLPDRDVLEWKIAIPPGQDFVTIRIPHEEIARYKPQPKEFNRFVNASDLLEDFIKYCGEQRVRQGEVLQLPVELFIKWLVIQAFEADGEPVPTEAVIEPTKLHPPQPRCLSCKRWMPRQIEIPLHKTCAPRYFEKVAA